MYKYLKIKHYLIYPLQKESSQQPDIHFPKSKRRIHLSAIRIHTKLVKKACLLKKLPEILQHPEQP